MELQVVATTLAIPNEFDLKSDNFCLFVSTFLYPTA